MIQFDHVSKLYKLGLTRTSLPAVASKWLRRSYKRASRDITDAQLIWALKDVSFELGQGQSLALVGPNGAGKTTILKLLANITKPTEGRFTAEGQLSALIELGAGFHPDLTGRENIYLNGTILGLRRKQIDSRFDQIVDFSEIERFIDTPVKRYSSGMIVRLGFAVAACIDPDILLVDEVLAVGDASFQQKCLERIQYLLQNGTSIIFVSHNLYLIRAVCQVALYLEHGQMKDYGKTEDVINTYEIVLHQERAHKLERELPKQSASGYADIEITHVQIVEVEGKETGELNSDQPAVVQIHYTAYRDIGSVNAAVFITRSDGVTCCMVRTSQNNVQFQLDKGTGIVSVTLDPVQLITGTYYLEGYFLNETDSLGIIGKRSDWFYVKGSGLSYEERRGVFEPNASWEHWRDRQLMRERHNRRAKSFDHGESSAMQINGDGNVCSD